MGETATAIQDTSQPKGGQTTPQPVAGQSPDGKGGSTSTQPRTYKEEEYQKGISDKAADLGRLHKAEIKALTAERDEFLGKHSKLESLTKTQKDKLSELEAQIEELTKDNAPAIDWLKRKREAQAIKDDYMVKLAELEDREKKSTQAIRRATETNLEIAAWDVANEYDGGDAVRLKNLALRMKIYDEEGLQELAETIWNKKTATTTQQNPTLHPDSSVTHGGGGGRTPTLEELRNSPPAETAKKVKSGEWVIPHYRSK